MVFKFLLLLLFILYFKFNLFLIFFLLPILSVFEFFYKKTIQSAFFNSIFIFIYFITLIPNINILNNFIYSENRYFGVDAISWFMLLLTVYLIPLCILSLWDLEITNTLQTVIIASFFLLEFFLILTFSSLNILLFYIFFESSILPIFIIIITYGSNIRRLRANLLMLIYTSIGAILFLVTCLFIFIETGTLNYSELIFYSFFSELDQIFFWMGTIFIFLIKLPSCPFHIWLPEAHVEAPTVGSMILAGLLLKLGVYGVIRYQINLFPIASIFFKPFIVAIAITSILYTSLATLRQIDLKKIIAYSSISHMNIVLLGLFSFNAYGGAGSIFLAVSHGISSPLIFYLIGILYDRFSSRNIFYYSGLATLLPVYSTILFLAVLSNIGFPGTPGFIGEIFIIFSIIPQNIFIVFLLCFSLVLGASYNILFFTKIIFGTLNTFGLLNNRLFCFDLTSRELFLSGNLMFLSFVMGVYPNYFLLFFYV